MYWILFVTPFVLIAIGVVFVAFTGGPRRARQAYLTRGNRASKVLFPLLFIGLGIAVPAAVIANREEAVGSGGVLGSSAPSPEIGRGKELFRQTCATFHSLEAANAQGVTGPSLDELGQLDDARVLAAIENGGTGQDRMPAGLLEGENAQAVAAYVAEVAGK